MKRLLRWIAGTVVGLAALGLVAYGVVYVRSEQILRRAYAVPAVTLALPTDAASIAEGRRLAIIRGCFGGCHGRQAEGQVMFDEPLVARIVAPDLTTATRRYDDSQLAVLIRNGVRPDGRSLIVMPSEAFIALDDDDLGRIIAFLRTLPAVAGPGASVSMRPLGRIGLAAGKFKLAAQLIADAEQPPAASGDESVRGRYLARTVCAGCHGTHLRGDSNPSFTSPDLGVVAAYSPAAFAQLLRTGEALGGRNLPTMGPWSRGHLSLLTDAEIGALYSYLHSLGSAAAVVAH